MAGSAADAISQAVERSKQLLFPFKPEKWFGLGFTVFLAKFLEVNFSFVTKPGLPFGGWPTTPSRPPGSTSSASGEFQKTVEDLLHALQDDLGLYVGLTAGGVLVTVGLLIVVVWFSSRAKLMLVESVVWDRVDLGPQWTRAAELGMSLFKFRLWVLLAVCGLAFGSVSMAVFVGLSDFQVGHVFGSQALLGYALLGLASLLLGVPLAITMLLLDDFVVPLMVVRNVKVGEAWSICRKEVLSGNIAGVVVFYILRFVLSLGLAILLMLLACVTCCLSTLPYLGTVLVLPVFIFWRAFPLYYLEQLGLQIFPAPEPSWVAYDQWRFPR